ncbi:LOW QUALITY PROTEIN: uncharacterized protein LOC142235771 [Haematobia irritans]|uniref:LOW QUALITY PROTEIN: uncharacterized protein LOC142235771 n=1 Tax=Haematobia irritans TaxID=7368 RepID=UPI003F4F77D9
MTTSDEAFCHDHIQHPLMWCDEKRRLVERKNAEESMRMWRRRKTEEIARKEKDKQEYFELMVKHCPWGRPGGGAPNVDVRRKDITAAGLHSTQPISTTHRLASLPPCRFSEYFTKHKKCFDPAMAYTPHHYHHHSVPRVTTHTHTVQHVPDRPPPIGGTTSMINLCDRDIPTAATSVGGGGGGGPGAGGKNAESLHITLKDHPSMSFRNKGHVDIEVRYKPTPVGKGKPMLEKIVVTESDKCPIIEEKHCHAAVGPHGLKHKKVLEKIEKPPCKDPWGKPGPGGKPWRSPKSVGTTFMKSLGWTNKEMLKELDQDNPATPAEKPTFRKARPSRKPTRCCNNCTCKCGGPGGVAAPMTTSPIKPMHKPPPPPSVPVSNPCKAEPKPKFVHVCCDTNKVPADIPTTDNSANPTTRHCNDAIATGSGVELVPLLARRRAYNRPISLSTTDITKHTPSSHDRYACKLPQHCHHHSNICLNSSRNHKIPNPLGTCCLKSSLCIFVRIPPCQYMLLSTNYGHRLICRNRLHTSDGIGVASNLLYRHDLNTQVMMKRRSISLARQQEKDLCTQHFNTFDTFWGRPGHGAQDIKTRKLKLNNLLYGTPGCTSD